MLRESVGAETSADHALCHTNPNFDLDYQNKRSNTPNNMSSRKRSSTYCSTNTYAPSVAICIARIMCHVKRSNMYWSTNMSSLKSSSMYWSTNMSSRIGSNIH